MHVCGLIVYEYGHMSVMICTNKDIYVTHIFACDHRSAHKCWCSIQISQQATSNRHLFFFESIVESQLRGIKHISNLEEHIHDIECDLLFAERREKMRF